MVNDTNLPLILDLVQWVAARPRAQDEALEAWRTSCPRLTIWEDSLDAGYIRRAPADMITATEKGLGLLRENGRTL